MENHWEPYIRHLRDLPFVKNATIGQIRPFIKNGMSTYEADALLNIKTPQGNREFYVDEKKTHLTYALADGLAARVQKASKTPWILFAIHVPRKIGRYLSEHGINYVDKAGNCRLQIGTDYMAVIEGQTPISDPASGRGSGYQDIAFCSQFLQNQTFLIHPCELLPMWQRQAKRQSQKL